MRGCRAARRRYIGVVGCADRYWIVSMVSRYWRMAVTGLAQVWPRAPTRLGWLMPSPKTKRSGNASVRVRWPIAAVEGSRPQMVAMPVTTTSRSVALSRRVEADRRLAPERLRDPQGRPAERFDLLHRLPERAGGQTLELDRPQARCAEQAAGGVRFRHRWSSSPPRPSSRPSCLPQAAHYAVCVLLMNLLAETGCAAPLLLGIVGWRAVPAVPQR